MTNPFKVNNFYKEKYKILKSLYDHWEDGERKTNFAHQITDLGKSLSVLDIQDKTALHRRQIEQLVISLSNAGHINLYQKDQDPNQKNHKWSISESGRQAIADNYYLNQQGLDNRSLFFKTGGFIIALVGVILSVISLYQSNSLEKRVEKLETIQDNNKANMESLNKNHNDTLKAIK